jgi:hypothetical protein
MQYANGFLATWRFSNNTLLVFFPGMFGRHFPDGFTGFQRISSHLAMRAFVTKEHEPRSTRMMLMRRTSIWANPAVS